MGNDISRNSDDITVHGLTSTTVIYLNNYHILPEYLSDRTKADKLISTTATKAMKNVNTDFRIKLSSNRKRKYKTKSSTADNNTENLNTTKRRSPRKVSFFYNFRYSWVIYFGN